MHIRSKFVVNHVTRYPGGYGEVELSARRETSIPEDKQFADATPTGKLTMTITKPAVVDAMEPGSIWYLDFTPAPDGTSPMHV